MRYHYYLVIKENGEIDCIYMTAFVVDTAKVKSHIAISKTKFEYLRSIGIQEI